MIELGSRVLMDMGLARGRAITIVGSAGLLFGIPSALKIGIFQNQDWVWGVALMLSGFFFAFAVLRYGVTRWRETFINHEGSDMHIGPWWDWAIRLVAVEAVVLAVWWLWGAQGDDLSATWTLFSPYNVGSVLIQFAVVLVVLVGANKWLAKVVREGSPEAAGD
jgi:NSS family neurotransmitter:Na+ symporter